MRLVWARAAIGVVAFAAIVLLVVAPFVPPASIDFGLTFGPRLSTGALSSVIVAPGSIAARAGIRSGELLRFDPDTPDERIRYITLRRDESIAFADRQTGRRFVLSDPAAASMPVVPIVVQSVIFLSYAAIALVLVRRRSADRRALDLAAFLAFFALGSALASVALPYARSYWWVLSGIFVQSSYVSGGGFATLFAASFPRPFASGFRAIVRRLAVPVTIFGLAATLAGIGGQYAFSSPVLGSDSIFPIAACWGFFIFGSVASLVVTLREAQGLERQQLLWIALTFGAGFSGLLVFFVALLITGTPGVFQFASLTVGVIPFGLAYVILRHRVVDVGFALNRAAVFGGVSLVVVAMFVALEWFISKYLLTVGHVASSTVELAVALAIGFSLRPVHARIDAIVDDLFFRKRHEAEQRLRRFARELPFFTNRAIALQRTCETVTECVDAAQVSVYERTAAGFRNAGFDGIPILDDNDAAVVSYKAWHDPVALYESGSALGDGLAFGLQVREETIGFLVLGPKSGGEEYAPDERDALENVARALASLLDALEIAELRARLSRAGTPATA